MKQITEDYVSYETAVLLKEKGFDECVYTCYTVNDYPLFMIMIDYVVQDEIYERIGNDCHIIQAPTHQMALKWLREVHNIHIEIRYVPNQFTDEPDYKAMIWDMSEEIGRPLPDDIEYAFYETCVNDALKYTLENLI